MRLTKFNEKGQALIVIALAAVALFGFVGLAIDGSAKYSDRRNAQNAADTAALAAALAKVNAITAGDSNTPLVCTSADMSTASEVCVALVLAGLDRADSNGYDTSNSTIQVYSPPANGYYATVVNSDDYVQVIITSHIKTTFMRIFGFTQTDNIVNAVAYVGEGGKLADGAMIIAYDPHPGCSGGSGIGGGSVDVSGSSTVNLNGGGIFVNSQETCGYTAPNCPSLTISGGAGINSAATVDNIVQKDSSASCIYPAAPENLNQDPLAIPDDVYIPAQPAECGQVASAYNTGGDTWHITPGYYIDFPQKTLNGNDPTKLVGNKKDIIMDPGVYCVGADIQWSGNTFNSLTGNGVTIYMKSGTTFSLSINAPIKLYAPHSGTDYDGYLIIQDGTQSNIKNCKIDGGAYLDIEGIIYAPYCNITVNGGSEPTAAINAQLAGWHITINGNNTINFNYNPDYVLKVKRRLGLMK